MNASIGRTTPIVCPNCRSDLCRLQPDVELPDRLLGVCRTCKTWFLLDAVRGVMAVLAGPELLSTATVSDRQKP
jgi:hypothetical protein